MTPLEAVKLANTGLILWDALGPALERAIKSGEPVDMDQVEAASVQLGSDLDKLKVAIELKKIRDAAG
jgi:hypothetical protein